MTKYICNICGETYPTTHACDIRKASRRITELEAELDKRDKVIAAVVEESEFAIKVAARCIARNNALLTDLKDLQAGEDDG